MNEQIYFLYKSKSVFYKKYLHLYGGTYNSTSMYVSLLNLICRRYLGCYLCEAPDDKLEKLLTTLSRDYKTPRHLRFGIFFIKKFTYIEKEHLEEASNLAYQISGDISTLFKSNKSNYPGVNWYRFAEDVQSAIIKKIHSRSVGISRCSDLGALEFHNRKDFEGFMPVFSMIDHYQNRGFNIQKKLYNNAKKRKL